MEAKAQIVATDCWDVWLPKNQAWLGRACLTLRTHKSSLSELSEQEWKEFHALVKQLESAYAEAFGARPINWGCFMNDSFQKNPALPHVHWHAFPRYEKKITVGGIMFDDPLFGHHYNPNAKRVVEDEVLENIATSLKAHL